MNTYFKLLGNRMKYLLIWALTLNAFAQDNQLQKSNTEVCKDRFNKLLVQKGMLSKNVCIDYRAYPNLNVKIKGANWGLGSYKGDVNPKDESAIKDT